MCNPSQPQGFEVDGKARRQGALGKHAAAGERLAGVLRIAARNLHIARLSFGQIALWTKILLHTFS